MMGRTVTTQNRCAGPLVGLTGSFVAHLHLRLRPPHASGFWRFLLFSTNRLQMLPFGSKKFFGPSKFSKLRWRGYVRHGEIKRP